MRTANTYVIMGASGNVGGEIARQLLSKGKSIRIITRKPEKVKDLQNKGAQVFQGLCDDPFFMKEVFHGAEAAFVMTPPNYLAADHTAYQLNTGKAIAAALETSQVKFLVNLSSYHAEDLKAPIILKNLYTNERILNELDDISILHLRPAYFMENLFSFLPLIPSGFTASMLQPNLSLPMIATRDIGIYASKKLLDLDFEEQTALVLLGQRNLTPIE
ncbi:MAG: NmrA family NAD(P)-binding protein, partial [Chitinophagaceae bacterium]